MSTSNAHVSIRLLGLPSQILHKALLHGVKRIAVDVLYLIGRKHMEREPITHSASLPPQPTEHQPNLGETQRYPFP